MSLFVTGRPSAQPVKIQFSAHYRAPSISIDPLAPSKVMLGSDTVKRWAGICCSDAPLTTGCQQWEVVLHPNNVGALLLIGVCKPERATPEKLAEHVYWVHYNQVLPARCITDGQGLFSCIVPLCFTALAHYCAFWYWTLLCAAVVRACVVTVEQIFSDDNSGDLFALLLKSTHPAPNPVTSFLSIQLG